MHGGTHTCSLTSVTFGILPGGFVGASPDGRKSQEPLNEGGVSTGRKAVGHDLVAALRPEGIDAFPAGDSIDGGNIEVVFDVAMNL